MCHIQNLKHFMFASVCSVTGDSLGESEYWDWYACACQTVHVGQFSMLLPNPFMSVERCSAHVVLSTWEKFNSKVRVSYRMRFCYISYMVPSADAYVVCVCECVCVAVSSNFEHQAFHTGIRRWEEEVAQAAKALCIQVWVYGCVSEHVNYILRILFELSPERRTPAQLDGSPSEFFKINVLFIARWNARKRLYKFASIDLQQQFLQRCHSEWHSISELNARLISLIDLQFWPLIRRNLQRVDVSE